MPTTIDSMALSRMASNIEQIQRARTASWAPADALAHRNAMPRLGATPSRRRLPPPKVLRELAAGLRRQSGRQAVQKRVRALLPFWGPWLRLVMDMQSTATRNRPGSRRSVVNAARRGKPPWGSRSLLSDLIDEAEGRARASGGRQRATNQTQIADEYLRRLQAVPKLHPRMSFVSVSVEPPDKNDEDYEQGDKSSIVAWYTPISNRELMKIGKPQYDAFHDALGHTRSKMAISCDFAYWFDYRPVAAGSRATRGSLATTQLDVEPDMARVMRTPNQCPFCYSRDREESLDSPDDAVYQVYRVCMSCGSAYVLFYNLDSVRIGTGPDEDLVTEPDVRGIDPASPVGRWLANRPKPGQRPKSLLSKLMSKAEGRRR